MSPLLLIPSTSLTVNSALLQDWRSIYISWNSHSMQISTAQLSIIRRKSIGDNREYNGSKGNNICSSYKVVCWHLCRCDGKFTITLQFVICWHNVNVTYVNVKNDFFGIHKVKWLQLTGEVGKSEMWIQNFLGISSTKKIIQIGFDGVIKKNKLSILETVPRCWKHFYNSHIPPEPPEPHTYMKGMNKSTKFKV